MIDPLKAVFGNSRQKRKAARREFRKQKHDASARIGRLEGKVPVGVCAGACCVAFCSGKTHDAHAADKADLIDPLVKMEPEELVHEHRFVVNMLVPLTNAEANARYRKLVPLPLQTKEPFPEDEDPGKRQFFTCRHFDEATLRCNEYASRPLMCSEYPYARDCDHGCGFHYVYRSHTSPRGRRNLYSLTVQAANV